MKKLFIFVILIIGLAIIFKPNKEYRIRIIANSDFPYDQNIKLKIANELKEYLKTDHSTKDIENYVSSLLKNYNVNYQCKVTIRKEKFNPKVVDGKVIPGGKYQTLVIELGEAKGRNYWSLLYPEYFNISFEEETDVEVGFWLKDLLGG